MPGHGDLDRAEVLDLLSDLQHDLGKYLLMPLRFLPGDAEPEAVREALRRALHETSQGPSGTRPARAVWDGFVAEAPEALCALAGWRRLTRSIERALDWQSALTGDAPLDRAAVEADLAAVGDAISALRDTIDQSTTEG